MSENTDRVGMFICQLLMCLVIVMVLLILSRHTDRITALENKGCLMTGAHTGCKK